MDLSGWLGALVSPGGLYALIVIVSVLMIAAIGLFGESNLADFMPDSPSSWVVSLGIAGTFLYALTQYRTFALVVVSVVLAIAISVAVYRYIANATKRSVGGASFTALGISVASYADLIWLSWPSSIVTLIAPPSAAVLSLSFTVPIALRVRNRRIQEAEIERDRKYQARLDRAADRAQADRRQEEVRRRYKEEQAMKARQQAMQASERARQSRLIEQRELDLRGSSESEPTLSVSDRLARDTEVLHALFRLADGEAGASKGLQEVAKKAERTVEVTFRALKLWSQQGYVNLTDRRDVQVWHDQKVSLTKRGVKKVITPSIEGEIVMGDKFEASGQAQVGNMGNKATIDSITFGSQEKPLEGIDLGALLFELEILRREMRKQAVSTEEDAAVLAIGQAMSAAENEDAAGTAANLKGAGKWALGVASTIGSGVALAAIKMATGL